MFVFGTKNYKKLCTILMIPSVGVKATKYWFLPIYKVEINFDGDDSMTSKQKLNALVDYIYDAERYHLDNARRGIDGSGYKSMAVQDITLFMEHELGLE